MKASYIMDNLKSERLQQRQTLQRLIAESNLQMDVVEDTEDRINKLQPILDAGDRDLTDEELQTLGYVR